MPQSSTSFLPPSLLPALPPPPYDAVRAAVVCSSVARRACCGRLTDPMIFNSERLPYVNDVIWTTVSSRQVASHATTAVGSVLLLLLLLHSNLVTATTAWVLLALPFNVTSSVRQVGNCVTSENNVVHVIYIHIRVSKIHDQ